MAEAPAGARFASAADFVPPGVDPARRLNRAPRRDRWVKRRILRANASGTERVEAIARGDFAVVEQTDGEGKGRYRTVHLGTGRFPLRTLDTGDLALQKRVAEALDRLYGAWRTLTPGAVEKRRGSAAWSELEAAVNGMAAALREGRFDEWEAERKEPRGQLERPGARHALGRERLRFDRTGLRPALDALPSGQAMELVLSVLGGEEVVYDTAHEMALEAATADLSDGALRESEAWREAYEALRPVLEDGEARDRAALAETRARLAGLEGAWWEDRHRVAAALARDCFAEDWPRAAAVPDSTGRGYAVVALDPDSGIWLALDPDGGICRHDVQSGHGVQSFEDAVAAARGHAASWRAPPPRNPPGPEGLWRPRPVRLAGGPAVPGLAR
ncbi:MAG: hypothetical protein J4F37_11720, partial [Acidobacteria bacterium]|nr:hypothetical protein [Acidobacteriota bacterium]